MKFKFPIEAYSVWYRCEETHELVSRESNTLEYVEHVTQRIRELCGNALAETFIKYLHRATALSYGRNRVVLTLGRYVVKFPTNYYGIGDNDWEGSISGGDYIQYARTRMHYVDGIPIVFMEHVNPVSCFEGLPDWVNSVDCGQVGHNRAGKLVAFDYGFN